MLLKFNRISQFLKKYNNVVFSLVDIHLVL